VCAQTIWMLSGKVVLSIDFHMNQVSLRWDACWSDIGSFEIWRNL